MPDLRIPIGGFFALLGVIIALTGVITQNHAPLEFANVNLYCGGSMILFGLVMLWLARRSS